VAKEPCQGGGGGGVVFGGQIAPHNDSECEPHVHTI